MMTYLVFLIFCLFISSGETQPERFTYSSAHMGTKFRIILYARDDSLAGVASRAAFDRVRELDSILSDYKEHSELNRLTDSYRPGEWVEVSNSLFHIIEQADRVAEKTDGLFDLTIGPFTHLWRTLRRMQNPKLPDERKMDSLSKRVDYEYLELNRKKRAVRLLKPGMQLDPGGIAKGYTAGEALKVLSDYGIESALVNAGGDIAVGSPPPDRKSWTVAVPLPRKKNRHEILTLRLSDKAVSTSGNMYQYIEIGNKTYSHVIDPRKGLGVTRQVQATVIAPDGTRADAYASVLNIMKPEKGIRLINQLSGVEAYIEQNDENGVSTWQSDGFGRFVADSLEKSGLKGE